MVVLNPFPHSDSLDVQPNVPPHFKEKITKIRVDFVWPLRRRIRGGEPSREVKKKGRREEERSEEWGDKVDICQKVWGVIHANKWYVAMCRLG